MARDHDRAAAGTVPFWAHQLAEMLLGGLLLIEGARTGQHTAVLVGLGGALLVLSLMSDGALGAWPWIGRRLHRVLDFAAAAILATGPLLLSLSAPLAIVVLEAAALGMVWLALRTNWSPRRAPKPGRAVGTARTDGPRQLGRAVGRARAKARRPPKPEP
jgi:hypothetical protein